MLYKSKIIIWTDFNPDAIELDRLAWEATNGSAYCSSQEGTAVLETEVDNDPDWDPNACGFFGLVDE